MISLMYLLVSLMYLPASASESKTSSECFACRPNTPHNLSCTGSSVIVIQNASYGYKAGCTGGITGAGCTEKERNRCCKPGGPSTNCLESFKVTDREELERTCSSKSTCTFNSIRRNQLYTCGFTFINSFTLINYACQTSASSTNATKLTSSSPVSKDTSVTHITTIETSTQSSASTETSSSSASMKVTSPPTSSNDGDDVGIIVGVIIGVLLVTIAAIIIIFVIRRKRQNENNVRRTPSIKNTINNSVQGPPPVYHVVEKDVAIPRKQVFGLSETVANGNQSHISSKKKRVDTIGNYTHIDDEQVILKKLAGISGNVKKSQECDYDHIEDGNSPMTITTDDTYNHIGGDNSKTKMIKDSTYNHISGDKSNIKITKDETYNHVESDSHVHEDNYHHIDAVNSHGNNTFNDTYNHTNYNKNLQDDDYHHIDINNDQGIVNDPEYNHIGEDDGGYHHIGDPKSNFTDNDHYNHLCDE